MNNLAARTEFCKYIGGRNFMTPTVLEYYQGNNRIVELSIGKFMQVELFGVTVVDLNKHNCNLSKPFNIFSEAKTYIETLIGKTLYEEDND